MQIYFELRFVCNTSSLLIPFVFNSFYSMSSDGYRNSKKIENIWIGENHDKRKSCCILQRVSIVNGSHDANCANAYVNLHQNSCIHYDLKVNFILITLLLPLLLYETGIKFISQLRQCMECCVGCSVGAPAWCLN